MNLARVRATHASPTFDTRCLDTVFLATEPPEGWPETFAIVTGCNPVRELHEPDHSPDEQAVQNEARNARLLQTLRDENLNPFPVVGASPDLLHQEPGYGFATVALPLAARLANGCKQWGFFWVQPDGIYICIDDSGVGWYVGSWASRLRPLPLSDDA